MQPHSLSVWRRGGQPGGQWDPAELGAPPGSQTGPSHHTGSQAQANRSAYTDIGLSVLLTCEKEAHKRWKQETKEGHRETLWAHTDRARKSSLHVVPRDSAGGKEHRLTLQQAMPRGCGVPILGEVQNQTARGPEQPALADSAWGRGGGWDDLQPQPRCDFSEKGT